MDRLQLCMAWCMTLVLLAPSLWAQPEDMIVLRNPSFEDFARAGTDNGKAPRGWYDCGKPGETAPDVHSGDPSEIFFKVSSKPFHEGTYLGMVVRENETWEAVSQRLSQPLEQGNAYTFGIHLARSNSYFSPTKNSKIETNYDTPVKVRIWGGNGYCRKDELLDETGLINHTSWRQYQFRFEPKKNHTFILIEAFWKTPVIVPYNGNVLVDNATPIYLVPKDEPSPPLPINDPPVVEILNPRRSGLKSEDNTFTVKARVENVKYKKEIAFSVNGQNNNFSFDVASGSFRAAIPLVEGENKIRIKASNAGGSSQDDATVVYTPKIVDTPPVVTQPADPPPPPPVKETYVHNPELNEKPQSGKKIRIDKLYFQADSSRITEDAFPILDEFASYLRANPEVKIEIGGHTNNRCHEIVCDRLSEDRAKAVADYLAGKGIRSNRMTYKGYGKREPIANNDYFHGRRKNQRVEIKIL